MAKYIPEQHFKGIRVDEYNQGCPLAFITPYGVDAPAKKRIETVKDWSSGEKFTEIIDNNPLTGFKISKEVRRWSTSNVVWRIEDPRGFELEISSGNMAYLISECVFNKGVIEDELIWCRDGSQNFLLPTNSDEYSDYNLLTQCIKSGLKLKDINIGDIIQLTSGESGKYLGVYNLVGKDDSYYNNFLNNKRRYILLTKDGDYVLKSALKDIQLIEHGVEEDNKNWENDINIPNTYISKKKQNVEKILNTYRIVDDNSKLDDGDIFEYQSDYYHYMKHSYYVFRCIVLNVSNNHYENSYVDYYQKTGMTEKLQQALFKNNVQKKKIYVVIDDKEFELRI